MVSRIKGIHLLNVTLITVIDQSRILNLAIITKKRREAYSLLRVGRSFRPPFGSSFIVHKRSPTHKASVIEFRRSHFVAPRIVPLVAATCASSPSLRQGQTKLNSLHQEWSQLVARG